MINETAERISAEQWEARMAEVPEDYRRKCAYLRSIVPDGVSYLRSPHEYSCRGDMLLRRLKFDSSLASLRLWAFLFSERDRLFLAKDNGWQIYAAMKDLGSVPILSYAVPNSLTFYADELWWAPCFAEEPKLLDEARKLGAGDELCFVRAALGAMITLDYFPRPDLTIAAVGAVCDDFSAVMQLIEGIGIPTHWWELPIRFDHSKALVTERFEKTIGGGSAYQVSAKKFVMSELKGIVNKLEEVSGVAITEEMLAESLGRFNEIRKRVARLRDLVYGSARPPLPGLEMMLVEFIAIHACSDPDESIAVLDDLLDTVAYRLGRGISPLVDNPIRVFWAMPPTDASLITLLEDLGGCIAGTEYLITHAFYPLSEDVAVLSAVADSVLDDPMIGSPAFRAKRIAEGAKKYGAEGVIISGITGASHCPFDEKAIAREVELALDIPVLSFDVPYSPGKLSEQVINRMEAFMELLGNLRKISTSALDYFHTSMSTEVDYVNEAKRAGRGVVGIYCEFTPRELILAAGAVPVCLCGTNASTIPIAETVLPANLCPLIKSSYGYLLNNQCPFTGAADLIVAETTCDGKKKMYELIAENRAVHVLELTQKVREPEAFSHWLDEVRKLKTALEEKFGVAINDERLRGAIKLMNKERGLLKTALSFGMEEPAIVTGMELSLLRYRVAGVPGHIEMLQAFIDELHKRKAEGRHVAKPSAPRILLTGCPTGEGTTKIIEIIEECGAIVVVQETCSGWKPLDLEVDESMPNPLTAISEKYFALPCSCMTPNTGRTELIGELARKFKVNGVIDLVWQACHTYNIESHLVEKFVVDSLGLPFMKIETDYSDSDRERLKIRVQTMIEMMS